VGNASALTADITGEPRRTHMGASREQIIDYWARVEDECGMAVDWGEAHERCWRCGDKSQLEKCHIVPAPLGDIESRTFADDYSDLLRDEFARAIIHFGEGRLTHRPLPALSQRSIRN
jgi:hypothetical protein